jgi:DNA-binding MarR family transcriptional regulator/predicted N-acetyltransferase YhbS
VDDLVTTLRQFNRSHTQRVGALDDSFLGSGRPLGPSRLLFEIGLDGAAVLDLRRRLGLDSGYLSRLLRRLEDDGLVAVETDPNDRRRRVARLTPRGRDEWHELDRRSDVLAVGLVAPLRDRQRAMLAEALTTADRLLRSATVEFEAIDVGSDPARWAIGRYFAELDERFAHGFDADDATAADAVSLSPPLGEFVVARDGANVIACGGIQRIDGTTAEVKRMWVHPEWRGAGIGRRLLTHLEERIGALGYRRVVLDTNATLTEAIAMYETAGYTATERYNGNPYAQRWFAKDLG